MFDPLEELLRASSDEERADVTTRIAVSALRPELGRAVLRAAVPLWLDARLLAALLDLVVEDAEAIQSSLNGLSYVEAFADRGFSIHERTRLSLLRFLRADSPATLTMLHEITAAHALSRRDESVHWLVAGLYHLILAGNEEALGRFRVHANELPAEDWYLPARSSLLSLLLPMIEAHWVTPAALRHLLASAFDSTFEATLGFLVAAYQRYPNAFEQLNGQVPEPSVTEAIGRRFREMAPGDVLKFVGAVDLRGTSMAISRIATEAIFERTLARSSVGLGSLLHA